MTARRLDRSAKPRRAWIACAPLLLAAAACSPRWDRTPAHPPPSGPPIVAHRTSIPWLPPSVARHARLIDEASLRHGVDANLVAVVILVESGGDPAARSPAGALGLMQLMPETAADIARKRGLPHHDEGRLLDPAYNVDLGAFYLGEQVRRFWTGYAEATVEYAAGAYNGGPGRMRRHLEEGQRLPAETRSYQRWVGGMWRERFMPRSATFAAWYDAGGERLVASLESSLAGR